jgi:putative hemolysin
MRGLRKGRYDARLAEGAADIRAAQELRTLAFRAGQGALDADPFDERCRHILVHDTRDGTLVCCFRLLPLAGGASIEQSYSAQF